MVDNFLPIFEQYDIVYAPSREKRGLFIDSKLDASYDLGRAIVLRGCRWRAAQT